MNASERALREICGGEDRYRVFSFLFSHPNDAFHVRGLAQEARVDPSNAARLLARFVDVGLCTRSEDGLYVRYSARADHPLFSPLVDLFTQTREVEVALRGAASGLPGTILLFGSYARGEERPDSDIDVLVLNEDSGIAMAAEFKPLSR